MHGRIRQVTDSVHGTVFISDLEYQMMSTSFFYRLHDVYQSSTVYMTFPSNRTKRYEHSLGTMELAGQMFYSAVTNASTEDKKHFMDSLQSQFYLLLETIRKRERLMDVNFYSSLSDPLSSLIPKSICNKDKFCMLLKNNRNVISFQDAALSKQEVCFLDLVAEGETNNTIERILEYSFLYQSALEALRIAALFHDIGHPPFSHIIESTLKKIYKSNSADYNHDKLEAFKRSLEKFIERNAIESMLIENNNTDTQEDNEAELHEQVGLHILYNAFHGVFYECVSTLKSDNAANYLKVLYLITVVEFTFGILLEKAPIFAALHKIIAGPVDADRLDYCVRDARNAGVDWGGVSYARIVSAVKFYFSDNRFIIAFPEKVCDDIDDLLVARYKVFQRINYHHKSIKTSELMQRCVEFLAEDYLRSPDKEISKDIELLWSSLGAAFGQNEVENKISQWTDSWLISVLSATLIRLSDTEERSGLVNNETNRTKEDIDKLYCMLEEIQLSRKRYFPLLKRQNDALNLMEKVLKRAKITNASLDRLISHEYERLVSGREAESALEALRRLSVLKDQIISVANFGLFDLFFQNEKTCAAMIKDVLDKAQEEGRILDYFLWKNNALLKTGVSDKEEIFLYRYGNQPYKYNLFTSLIRKLNAQKAGSLWLYAYVCLPDHTEIAVESIVQDLLEKIAEAIGDGVFSAMQQLFDFEGTDQPFKSMEKILIDMAQEI